MSPVSRAAPRSAAAIAGQATRAGSAGRGSKGLSRGWGSEGARQEARKLGPGGARLEEKNGELRGGEQRAGEGRPGRGGGRGGPRRGGGDPEAPRGRRAGNCGEGERCGVGRRREGSRLGGAGGRAGGRARAEDGEGGSAGRNLEVCAGRGFSLGGEGTRHAMLARVGRPGTQEVAGTSERRSKRGGTVSSLEGHFFKSWGRGYWER